MSNRTNSATRNPVKPHEEGRKTLFFKTTVAEILAPKDVQRQLDKAKSPIRYCGDVQDIYLTRASRYSRFLRSV